MKRSDIVNRKSDTTARTDSRSASLMLRGSRVSGRLPASEKAIRGSRANRPRKNNTSAVPALTSASFTSASLIVTSRLAVAVTMTASNVGLIMVLNPDWLSDWSTVTGQNGRGDKAGRGGGQAISWRKSSVAPVTVNDAGFTFLLPTGNRHRHRWQMSVS